MKTRVISAVVAIAVLLGVVYLGGTAIGIAVFLLSMGAIYEFYKALEKINIKPVYAAGYISCLSLLFLTFLDKLSFLKEAVDGQLPVISVFAWLFLLMVVFFCLIMFSGGKYSVNDVSATLFGIVYIVFMFSFVILTRSMSNGYLYIWLIFIGAWATDTFAFFTGVTVGKTKIVPKISPKKSLEGCIGGVVGCVAAMTVFGWAFRETLNVPLYNFAIIGAICGVISQIGDWAASSVKRAANIKDYGNIMPGHGGILDRVDSILFVAPSVYFYISLFF